jgi:hypothetical protein
MTRYLLLFDNFGLVIVGRPFWWEDGSVFFRSNRWNANWQGKLKCSEKTCPSATMSTTNPTWPDAGSNPGRRCGKPSTNLQSYGTDSVLCLLSYPEDGDSTFLRNVLIFGITEVDGFVTFIELVLKGAFVVSAMTFRYRRHWAGCWRGAGFESGL